MSKRGRPVNTQKVPKRIPQNVLIEPEQATYLDEVTKIQGVSKAEIVREALNVWMQANSVINVSRRVSFPKQTTGESISSIFGLEPEQVDYLDRIANATTISKSAIIREVLNTWIQSHPLQISSDNREE